MPQARILDIGALFVQKGLFFTYDFLYIPFGLFGRARVLTLPIALKSTVGILDKKGSNFRQTLDFLEEMLTIQTLDLRKVFKTCDVHFLSLKKNTCFRNGPFEHQIWISQVGFAPEGSY